jgi:hypothetical protein
VKTSTLLLIGGAVAVGYYLSKRQADAVTGAATGALARTAVMTPTTQVVIVPPENDDYGSSWGWASPVWGGRAWRGGHGHGHGGHGHGGHH